MSRSLAMRFPINRGQRNRRTIAQRSAMQRWPRLNNAQHGGVTEDLCCRVSVLWGGRVSVLWGGLPTAPPHRFGARPSTRRPTRGLTSRPIRRATGQRWRYTGWGGRETTTQHGFESPVQKHRAFREFAKRRDVPAATVSGNPVTRFALTLTTDSELVPA